MFQSQKSIRRIIVFEFEQYEGVQQMQGMHPYIGKSSLLNQAYSSFYPEEFLIFSEYVSLVFNILFPTYLRLFKKREKYSHTGNRTRIGRVRACYPNQLDYMGLVLDSVFIYSKKRLRYSPM